MTIEPPQLMPYLTIIPDRNPRQKAHTHLGQAKKAVLYRLIRDELSVPCMVYQWTAKGWETLWNIPAGTDRKDMPWNGSRKN